MIRGRSGSVPAPIAVVFYLLKGEGRVVRFFSEVLDRSAIDAGTGSCAGSARFPAPIAYRIGNPGDLLFFVFCSVNYGAGQR
jgi:hypothetical protein